MLCGARHLIVDRDTKYSAAFRTCLARESVRVIRLPPRSPNLGDLHDSSGTHEQNDPPEHESIDRGQGRGRGAATGTAADDQCSLQQQRLGDDGVDAAGTSELGEGDNQLHREKEQVTHRQGRLPWTPISARLLICGGSRHRLANSPHRQLCQCQSRRNGWFGPIRDMAAWPPENRMDTERCLRLVCRGGRKLPH